MDDPKEPSRKSRINKGFLVRVLKEIGVKPKPSLFAPKKCRIAPKSRRVTHHLTAGKSANRKLTDQLAKESDLAYVVPADGQIVRTRKIRKSFHTHRSRLESHKLERLYIPEEILLSDDSEQETDPEFSRITNGRPLKDQGTLREHSWAVQSCFLTKLETGDLLAQVKRLENFQNKEEGLFKNTELFLQSQMDGFNQFLKEDHFSTVQWLTRAEVEENKTREQEKKIADFRKELRATKTRVQLLEDQWRKSKMLKEFLHHIAPLPWRRSQSPESKDSNIPTEPTTFDSLQDENQLEAGDLKTRIENFLKEKSTLKQPSLFFSRPEELFTIFNTLENRYSVALLQCEELKPSVNIMVSTLDQSVALFDGERSDFIDNVADLEAIVSTDEAKAEEFKASVKDICNQHLHKLLNNSKSVNITACVEDAYERVVGPNDTGLNALEMMKVIETMHESLVVNLDILPNAVVGKTKYVHEKESKRIMKEAHDAAKKVHQMNMLTKKLTNALQRCTIAPRRRLVFRSEPPKEKKIKEKRKAQLTTQELEHKVFFEDIKNNDIYRPL